MSDVTFHQAIKTDQLDEDEALQVIIEGKEVAIINLGGEFVEAGAGCRNGDTVKGHGLFVARWRHKGKPAPTPAINVRP